MISFYFIGEFQYSFCFGQYLYWSKFLGDIRLVVYNNLNRTSLGWAPRGAVWGGSSTYGFEAEPFQQWGLGTDMMIGLGRAAGLLRAPVGISVWDRDPQSMGLTPYLGIERGNIACHKSEARFGTGGTPREPGF